MEVSGQLDTPAALPLGKQIPVPTGHEDVWAPELHWILWRREKSLYPAGNRTSDVQPGACGYTDSVIPASKFL
jgi:hypothetical protein